MKLAYTFSVEYENITYLRTGFGECGSFICHPSMHFMFMIPWPNPTTVEDAATYKKLIAEHYKNIRENRTILPHPHPSLNTEQALVFRKVQTNTLLAHSCSATSNSVAQLTATTVRR